tara:strand:- start:956 stop:1162 length:207 start_codon:yes stop_codon:yes gene_type:complete
MSEDIKTKPHAFDLVKIANRIEMWVMGPEELELIKINKRIANSLINTGTLPTWYVEAGDLVFDLKNWR